jgi:hypothetical protein
VESARRVARTPEQLTDNLGATGWALDDDQLRRLTEVGDQSLPYPYELQRLPQFSFGVRVEVDKVMIITLGRP